MGLALRFTFSLLLVSFFFSCSPKFIIKKELLEAEEHFADHKGFLLYDPSSKKTLIDFKSHRYFTPASNTKIFTLFSGLQLLGDSIPALRYVERNDSLIFWGTGDPSFLYREVYQNSRVFNFLKNANSKLYFSSANFFDEHFGPGWAWDDYNYSFSPERSSFPIYGNLVSFTDSIDNKLVVSPSIFKDSVSTSGILTAKKGVRRNLAANHFVFDSLAEGASLTTEIPFKTSPRLMVDLLADTLNRDVILIHRTPFTEAKIFYSIPSDSLYKVMMQESDNFIAEQLLLMCAGAIGDSLKTQIAIGHVKKMLLTDIEDEPQWVDGSGLSRYNLFTPRAIVMLWEKILELVPQERLFQLLAIGGETGTIKNLYKNEEPYIYGKTGTLSNNHCLSGYLITRRNKVLIFSFMNNNYTTSTAEIRTLMESVLHKIYEKY